MTSVCLILGAGPGVGQSIARAFAEKGYHLALAARNVAKLEKLKTDLGNNFQISLWQCDVSNSSDIANVVKDVSSEYGAVEVLVFNAYHALPAKPTELNSADLTESFKVNVGAALAAAQCVLPKMKELKKGSILFTGGGFALYPSDEMTALSIGKAGLRVLAQCLHQELSPLGVHAGTVTVCGTVAKGTPFDPDKIAAAFIELHEQPQGSFDSEIMFTGEKK